jgi:hypothetical protein
MKYRLRTVLPSRVRKSCFSSSKTNSDSMSSSDLEYHLEDLRLSLLVSLSGFSPQLRLATREAYGKG